MAQEVLPVTYPNVDKATLKAICNGAKGVLVFRGNKLLENHKAELEALGIVNSDGNVNIEAVRAFLDGAFAGNDGIKIQTLPLIPEGLQAVFPRLVKRYGDHTWTFRKSDAEKFLRMLE